MEKEALPSEELSLLERLNRTRKNLGEEVGGFLLGVAKDKENVDYRERKITLRLKQNGLNKQKSNIEEAIALNNIALTTSQTEKSTKTIQADKKQNTRELHIINAKLATLEAEIDRLDAKYKVAKIRDGKSDEDKKE